MVCIVIVLAIITYFGYTEIFHPKSHNDLSDGEAAVHFIDVGQGDSVLIQTTEGSVLIDGGNTNMGSRVVEYLRDVGVAEIAYVVATHIKQAAQIFQYMKPFNDYLNAALKGFSMPAR